MPPLEIKVYSSRPDENIPAYALERGFYTIADIRPDGTLTIYKARRSKGKSFAISKKDLPHSGTIKKDIKDPSGWENKVTLSPGESHEIWLNTNTHFGKQRVTFKNIPSH